MWLSRSVIIAANVDPSIIIRQHPAIVIVPVEGEPNSRDEAMEVPAMNTAVTDPGETVIVADAVPCERGGIRDTTAHQLVARNAATYKRLAGRPTAHKWLAGKSTVYKRLAGKPTVHKRVAAWHSASGKAGASAEAASPA